MIRKVNEQDYQNIYNLVEEAFKTAKVSDGTEQDFVLQLRAGENFIPELEFVVEVDGKLIGHIMMTKQVIKTTNGDYTGVLIAPLCVALEYRNQKIGAKLVEYACNKAVELGYHAAFLCGDPAYYGRFGFVATSSFNIQNVTEIPDEYILGCELVDDALTNIQGTISVI